MRHRAADDCQENAKRGMGEEEFFDNQGGDHEDAKRIRFGYD